MRGRPWYCVNTHNATQRLTPADGPVLSPALGMGAFAEGTLVAGGQCTKVDPSADPAAAVLLGCGIRAGWVATTSDPRQPTNQVLHDAFADAYQARAR